MTLIGTKPTLTSVWILLAVLTLVSSFPQHVLCVTHNRRNEGGCASASRRILPVRRSLRQKEDTTWESSRNKPPRAKTKKDDYERRRNQWLERYGSLEALQSTFGAGPIWGDLNPEETRRLYHTLLPRSLLGLHEMGLMKPEELAPLAYNARIAAKEYARSRCIWTGRLATTAFDQYRNLKKHGRFGASSMTWEEIWQKYEGQIVQEECSDELNSSNNQEQRRPWRIKKQSPENLTMRIYLRILERSCVTNEAFDSLFLNDDNEEDDDDRYYLTEIASQLDNDVREVLLNPKESAEVVRQQTKAQKEQQKAARKEENKLGKAEKKVQRESKKAKKRDRSQRGRRGEKQEGGTITLTEEHGTKVTPRREVLRVLAGTRRKFRQMISDDT